MAALFYFHLWLFPPLVVYSCENYSKSADKRMKRIIKRLHCKERRGQDG